MKKILCLLVLFSSIGSSYSQKLVLDAQNNPVIVCTDMPAASVTTTPKFLGLGRVNSPVAQTVFHSFRVAKNDCPESESNNSTEMNWARAASINHDAYHENWADAIITKQEDTGCQMYYEKPDKSDQGKWRLPTQRELMLIFAHRHYLQKVLGTNFFDGIYWSSTEPSKYGAMIVDFKLGASTNNGKNYEYKYHVRCVMEVPLP